MSYNKTDILRCSYCVFGLLALFGLSSLETHIGPFSPMIVNYSFASEGHVVSLGTLEFLQILNIMNLPQHSFLTHGGQC